MERVMRPITELRELPVVRHGTRQTDWNKGLARPGRLGSTWRVMPAINAACPIELAVNDGRPEVIVAATIGLEQARSGRASEG